MSDIEARARAYADSCYPLGPETEQAYLAGARAEVELERKRILAAVNAHAVEHDWNSTGLVEAIKKIIEGDGV